MRTFSDEELCAFLERGARLASGAEWEPSGAATKTRMFGKECVHLAMGAELELYVLFERSARLASDGLVPNFGLSSRRLNIS